MTDRPQRDFDDLLIDGATSGSSPSPVRAEPVRKGPIGSRLDDWFGRLVCTPARLRAWTWGLPGVVIVIAAVLRLWNLGHPQALVFDETFYVKDAWTIWNLGFEGAWPENPDAGFAAGDVDAFTGGPSFIAHPPLGKWIIALGMAAFGATDSFGWRVSAAVCGILAVVLVILIAKRLFRSTAIAALAGFFLAIDGHAIVLSRVSLLDGILMFVTLLGVGAVLLDRQRSEIRFAQKVASGSLPSWGPVLWWRPWLLTAGAIFGLAAGVKWTGVYFLAAYGIYVVLVDMVARRRAGVPFWASGAILKQGPIAFLTAVPVALVAYVLTWSGWILTSGGQYRNNATDFPDQAWTGTFAWVPHWIQNLWHYHQEMYGYSINLRATHPYSANPLSWLFMYRPTSMYFVEQADGVDGCTVARCDEAITSIANPLIWYAGVAALLYLVYRVARYREWTSGFVLMGVVAGYLPWMLYLDRTVFQFYCVIFEPYMMLALAMTAKVIIGSRTDDRQRRTRGLWIVGVFVVAAVGLTVYFYPLWTAQQTSFTFWQAHMWFPSWV